MRVGLKVRLELVAMSAKRLDWVEAFCSRARGESREYLQHRSSVGDSQFRYLIRIDDVFFRNKQYP